MMGCVPVLVHVSCGVIARAGAWQHSCLVRSGAHIHACICFRSLEGVGALGAPSMSSYWCLVYGPALPSWVAVVVEVAQHGTLQHLWF